MAVVPLMAFAQFSGSGWYRVQSQASGRYLSVVDPSKIYRSNADVILVGLHCIAGYDERVAPNPATIVWIEQKRVEGVLTYINLIGQGLNFDAVMNGSASLSLRSLSPGYLLYGSGSGVARYIYDPSNSSQDNPYTASGQSAAYAWDVLPVTGSDQYFGVKPEVQATADGSYWATLYASFPFVAPTGMKVYTVSRVVDAYAVVKEVTGTVPTATPLLVRCSGATAAANKVTLKKLGESPAAVSGNLLKGNYYCYIDASREQKHNALEFNTTTMRILSIGSDGKPVFTNADDSNLPADKYQRKYLPANKCYLQVEASTPAELKIVTEEEYAAAGIRSVTMDEAVKGRKGVFTLDGQHLGDSTDGLQKGVYVVNGKKVVVK